MLPFRRFWTYYILIGLLAVATVSFGVAINIMDASPNDKIVFAGVLVAIVSVLITMWSQWHSARSQQTMAALLALRTDREYLEAAEVLKRNIPLGQEISDAQLAVLTSPPVAKADPDPGQAGHGFAPDFPEAVDFVLNQYEFLAAGVHEGALDIGLFRKTHRGVILGLGVTFERYIRETRKAKPRIWENFAWLFDRFARHEPPYRDVDLGDLPDFLLFPRHGYSHARLFPGHEPPWPWNRNR